MKTIYLTICIMLVISCFNFPAFSQQSINKRFSFDLPTIVTPRNQHTNFLKSAPFPEKSFYQRKSEWKQIIDTTWGPGASFEEKLRIFNTYAKAVHDTYCN